MHFHLQKKWKPDDLCQEVKAFYCCLQNWPWTCSCSSSDVSYVPKGHNYIWGSSSILYYWLPFEWGIMSIITSLSSTPLLKYGSAFVGLLFLVIFTLKPYPCLLTAFFSSIKCFTKHSMIVKGPEYNFCWWTWYTHTGF